MARPIVTPVAEDLYASLEPLAADDEDLDWPLLTFVASLALAWDWLHDLLVDDTLPADQDDPWSKAVDVDRAPAWALPWLGQLLGIRFPPGFTESQQREMIRTHPRYIRGTVPAIQAAVQLYLTGTRTVYVLERFGGNRWHVQITTFTSETPNPALLAARVADPHTGQKPAGYQFTFATVTGGTYEALYATHVDYNEVNTDFATYEAVFEDPAHT